MKMRREEAEYHRPNKRYGEKTHILLSPQRYSIVENAMLKEVDYIPHIGHDCSKVIDIGGSEDCSKLPRKDSEYGGRGYNLTISFRYVSRLPKTVNSVVLLWRFGLKDGTYKPVKL